jgi:hypothetical protein
LDVKERKEAPEIWSLAWSTTTTIRESISTNDRKIFSREEKIRL